MPAEVTTDSLSTVIISTITALLGGAGGAGGFHWRQRVTHRDIKDSLNRLEKHMTTQFAEMNRKLEEIDEKRERGNQRMGDIAEKVARIEGHLGINGFSHKG